MLESVGIPSELVRTDQGWGVIVSEDDIAVAGAEITEYRHDKAAEPPPVSTGDPLLGGALVGVIFYTAILVSVAVLNQVSAYGIHWMEAGEMQAGRVMSGEVWRSITALTLHADTLHLLSNLAFGGVFGLLAGRILGGGVAWLAIVVGGGMGNLLNAALRDPNHLSIGASTAVFACLGILVALALRPSRDQLSSSSMRRWSPLVAGVLLFATLGMEGERTDVLAHATGFVSGLAIGGFCSLIPRRMLANEFMQFAAAAGTWVLVVCCWVTAIVVG